MQSCLLALSEYTFFLCYPSAYPSSIHNSCSIHIPPTQFTPYLLITTMAILLLWWPSCFAGSRRNGSHEKGWLTPSSRQPRLNPKEGVLSFVLFVFAMHPWLAQKLLCKPGYPQTHRDLLDTSSRVLGLFFSLKKSLKCFLLTCCTICVWEGKDLFCWIIGPYQKWNSVRDMGSGCFRVSSLNTSSSRQCRERDPWHFSPAQNRRG